LIEQGLTSAPTQYT